MYLPKCNIQEKSYARTLPSPNLLRAMLVLFRLQIYYYPTCFWNHEYFLHESLLHQIFVRAHARACVCVCVWVTFTFPSQKGLWGIASYPLVSWVGKKRKRWRTISIPFSVYVNPTRYWTHLVSTNIDIYHQPLHPRLQMLVGRHMPVVGL